MLKAEHRDGFVVITELSGEHPTEHAHPVGEVEGVDLEVETVDEAEVYSVVVRLVEKDSAIYVAVNEANAREVISAIEEAITAGPTQPEEPVVEGSETSAPAE